MMDCDLFLSEEFMCRHPTDAARVLEQLEPAEVVDLLNQVATKTVANVLQRMSSPFSISCISGMELKRTAEIMTHLQLPVATEFCRLLDEKRRESILRELQPEYAEPIRLRLRYSRGSVGSLMNPVIAVFQQDQTAGEALAWLRKQPEYAHEMIFIVNREQQLAGVIRSSRLIVAEPAATLSLVMNKKNHPLQCDAKLISIVTHSGWEEFSILPVIDSNGIPIGELNFQTLRKWERQQITGMDEQDNPHTGKALAELYQVGLSGLLNWAINAGSGK